MLTTPCPYLILQVSTIAPSIHFNSYCVWAIEIDGLCDVKLAVAIRKCKINNMRCAYFSRLEASLAVANELFVD
jgi:hypothetical protein